MEHTTTDKIMFALVITIGIAIGMWLTPYVLQAHAQIVTNNVGTSASVLPTACSIAAEHARLVCGK
jgi:hypothetical protein